MRILLAHLVLIQLANAQTVSTTQTDSAEFDLLKKTFTGRVQKAITLQEAQLFFWEASKFGDSRYHARAAALISENYFEQLNKSMGEEWYHKAQTLFRSHDNYLEAGTTNLTIGNLLTRKYDFETGLPYLLKSVDDFAQAKNYNKQTVALNNLSLAYHDFGQYDKGIAYAQEALQVLSMHPQAINKNLYWYVFNNLGINYDDSNRPIKAIEAHRKALPFGINASDSSYSYNNLGNTFKKLKNYAEAEKYFTLSLQKSTDYEDQYHLASIFSNMVDIERLRKNYSKANLYLDSALYYARKSSSPEKLLDIYYYTYHLKKETGNYPEAAEYLHEHLQLKDSFFTAEKNKAVLQYQAKYETEKKERALTQTQLNLTKTELASKQKTYWLLLLSGGLLMAVLLFIVQRSRARLKEKQLSLEKQLVQEKADFELQQQRLEISRNLHDSIGAQLTLISATVDSLSTNKANTGLDVNKKLASLSQLCDASTAELKNTLWVLNKQSIMLADLRLKMLNFINKAGESQDAIDLHFKFDVTENLPLAAGQALNLFRLVQELVNNSIKHSGAKNIHLTLLQRGGSLTINFNDDGKGFDTAAAQHKSYGLMNMQNRVAELGGRMEVNSDATGTTYLIETTL